MRSVDMNTALKCRVVCKAWKKIVQDAGLHPIEAGKKGEELDAGPAKSFVCTHLYLSS
jgi:hypothetical protein